LCNKHLDLKTMTEHNEDVLCKKCYEQYLDSIEQTISATQISTEIYNFDKILPRILEQDERRERNL
ncbi:unnamed protein product, partial [Didymodactylos carnosus]